MEGEGGEAQAEQSGAQRPTAGEIYARVKATGEEELERGYRAIGFSALFAGGTLGFSALAAAASLTFVDGSTGKLVAALFYPIGFVAVVVGRALLFTENTLYPVTIILAERRALIATLRFWAVVLAANIVGVVLFTLLVVEGGAVPSAIADELAAAGEDLASGSLLRNLFSGILAGWLLALVAWLVEASGVVIGRIAVTWSLTFVVALAQLDHCVATTVEVMASTLDGTTSAGRFAVWLTVVTAGNLIGGVFIVAVLNYGQVEDDR